MPYVESGRFRLKPRTPTLRLLQRCRWLVEGYHRRRGVAASLSRGSPHGRSGVAQSLGLERYVPAFRDNEIDWEVLPKLTSEDLREIGVAAIGHRRKLLDAIAALGAAAPAAAVTAAPSDASAPGEAERRQ